ncbi:MAG: LysM domain-containing protein [Candidatus Dojkabacteria bacterium]|nr:LysM domain-containing protein [Candidatus Dojkabacteria bacterium]
MATVTVKSGDSVSQILKNLGVSTYGSRSSWDAVAQANKLNSKYTIYSGQKLIIPDSLLGKTSTTSTSTPAPTPAPTIPQNAPANSEELAEFLNTEQEELEALENFDPFDGETSGEAVSEFITGDALGMEGEAPVAPKFEETFNKLRLDMGLDSVESSINEYKNMIREQENLLMQQRNTERGKTQRLGVIEGRIDQATRDRQEQISWLSSNVQYLTDVANSAYTYINMTMQFKQMDYNTAKEAYDSEFNKRMAVYDSLVEQARDERDFKMALRQEQQKTASAQLSMYADMITSGQMRWSDMSEAEQLAIHKLEVQAGLPVGFTSRIKIPAGSTIKSITNRTDQYGNVIADIIYVDPYTGAVTVKHQTLGKTKVASSGGSTTTRNSYGYTSAQWQSMQKESLNFLYTLEEKYEDDIVNSGGTTGTGKTGGDRVLADWEIKKANSEFVAKYGKAGTELLYNALKSGGYQTWDFKNNKVAPLSILGI